MDAYDQAKGRLRQLDQLMGQIDKPKTPKASPSYRGALLQSKQ
nr:type IV secretion system protein [Pseudomonas syringae]